MRSVYLHRASSKSLEAELYCCKPPESSVTINIQENLQIIFLGIAGRGLAVEVAATRERCSAHQF